jgi:hypothetical protein
MALSQVVWLWFEPGKLLPALKHQDQHLQKHHHHLLLLEVENSVFISSTQASSFQSFPPFVAHLLYQ